MKQTVTKILSILCLIVVVVCGFTMPFTTLTGQYKEIISNFTGMFASVSDEQMATMEQELVQFGIVLDFKGTMEAFNQVLEPINDGQISMMDFVDISTVGTALGEKLNGVSMEGVSEEQLQLLEQAGLVSLIESFIMIGAMGIAIAYIALVPLGLFGLLVLAIVIRIILRLFNRRGLGVLIAIVGFLNASFMLGIPIIFEVFATEEFPIGAETTVVPYVIIGGCIASCILWAIGRGPKVKKVKEKVVPVPPVETPAAPVEEVVVPVEEIVAPVEEVPVVERTVGVIEETVEEATEEVEEEAVVEE